MPGSRDKQDGLWDVWQQLFQRDVHKRRVHMRRGLSQVRVERMPGPRDEQDRLRDLRQHLRERDVRERRVHMRRGTSEVRVERVPGPRDEQDRLRDLWSHMWREPGLRIRGLSVVSPSVNRRTRGDETISRVATPFLVVSQSWIGR
jgi:hypothetical protein